MGVLPSLKSSWGKRSPAGGGDSRLGSAARPAGAASSSRSISMNCRIVTPLSSPPTQAAAIVASWFGSKAGWRGQQFRSINASCGIAASSSANELPDRNAIVFATNDHRNDRQPERSYVKLLVIFGRDDNDLLLAANIAQGLQYSVPRQQRHRGRHQNPAAASPYDAPNWCAPTARSPSLS